LSFTRPLKESAFDEGIMDSSFIYFLPPSIHLYASYKNLFNGICETYVILSKNRRVNSVFVSLGPVIPTQHILIQYIKNKQNVPQNYLQ
jgi:hypothetical protein